VLIRDTEYRVQVAEGHTRGLGVEPPTSYRSMLEVQGVSSQRLQVLCQRHGSIACL